MWTEAEVREERISVQGPKSNQESQRGYLRDAEKDIKQNEGRCLVTTYHRRHRLAAHRRQMTCAHTDCAQGHMHSHCHSPGACLHENIADIDGDHRRNRTCEDHHTNYHHNADPGTVIVSIFMNVYLCG